MPTITGLGVGFEGLTDGDGRSGSQAVESGAVPPAVMGAALGWLALLPLAVVAVATSGTSGTGWLIPALVGALIAGVIGFLIGAWHLGWSGCAGAVVGMVAAGLLPFAINALGSTAAAGAGATLPALASGWAEAGRAVAIGLLIAAGTAVDKRSTRQMKVPSRPILPAGSLVLAAWIGGWFLIVLFGGRPA